MKNKGKILAASFVVFVCIFISYISVMASNSNLQFSENYKSDSHGEINYSINVGDKSQICALSLIVLYDSGQVKVKECNTGVVLSSTFSQINSQLNGKIVVTSITTTPITKAGELVNIVFEVIDEDAEFLNIDFEVVECVDGAFANILFSRNTVIKNNPLFKELNSDEISTPIFGVEDITVAGDSGSIDIKNESGNTTTTKANNLKHTTQSAKSNSTTNYNYDENANSDKITKDKDKNNVNSEVGETRGENGVSSKKNYDETEKVVGDSESSTKKISENVSDDGVLNSKDSKVKTDKTQIYAVITAVVFLLFVGFILFYRRKKQ